MVSVLTLSVVVREFKPWLSQTKEYQIGIYWLARNQDNVSEWSDRSTSGLLFQ